MTTLAEAVKNNDVTAVQEALQRPGGKAELNAPLENGELLLHVAIKAKNLAVARALLEAGANVNQGSDERGTTKGYTAAHFAARVGDIDALELLKEFRADFNRGANDGWTPLHTACFAGKSQSLRSLVEFGAKVNAKNEHGMTPLVFAANHGRVSDVRFILKNGGDVKFVDSNGDSLMHHTLHFRLQEMFEGQYDMPECQWDVAICIALNGAPVDRPNSDGKLPTAWVDECEMPSFSKVLKILSHNSEALIKAGAADLNYVSLLAAAPPVYQAMGLSAAHAKDLNDYVLAFDKERLAEKKRREEEAPAGGCPVMKGGRKKKGAAAAADGAAPAGHPPMDMANVKPGEDPSNGQCPFFKKKAQQEANSAAPAPAPAPASTSAATEAVRSQQREQPRQQQQQQQATVKEIAVPAGAPKLDWAFVYEHRVTILLLLVAFFLGSYVERTFGGGRGPRHAPSYAA